MKWWIVPVVVGLSVCEVALAAKGGPGSGKRKARETSCALTLLAKDEVIGIPAYSNAVAEQSWIRNSKVDTGANYLGKQFIFSSASMSSEGTFVSVTVNPSADTTFKPLAADLLPPQFLLSNPQPANLLIGHGASQELPPDAAAISLRSCATQGFADGAVGETAYQAVERCLKALEPRRKWTPADINLIVNDPQSLQAAREDLARFSRGGVVPLSNEGLNRFFWFKPEGYAHLVPARVLDIHQKFEPSGASRTMILVEWLGAETAQGEPTRGAGVLTEREAQTFRLMTEAQRRAAVIEFMNSLTPAEISVLKLAQKLRLRTASHFDGLNANPLDWLSDNNITSRILSRVEATWGSVADLLNEHEQSTGNWNVVDVFARLTPSYVMERFKPKAEGQEYVWVITEDGRLRIYPNGNLVALTVRLARASYVYAAGVFKFGKDGKINVNIDARQFPELNNAYKDVGRRLEDRANDLGPLIITAFSLQADLDVVTVDQFPVNLESRSRRRAIEELSFQAWWKENQHLGEQAARRTYRAIDRFGPGANDTDQAAYIFDDAEFYDLEMEREVVGRKARPVTVPKTLASWDSGNRSDAPKDIKEFLDALGETGEGRGGSPSARQKRLWGHYVLNTHAQNSIKQIHESYKRLVSRFKDTATHQVVNDAWKVFNPRMKGS